MRVEIIWFGLSPRHFPEVLKLMVNNVIQGVETSCAGVHIIPFSIPIGIDKFKRNGGKFFKFLNWGQNLFKLGAINFFLGANVSGKGAFFLFGAFSFGGIC